MKGAHLTSTLVSRRPPVSGSLRVLVLATALLVALGGASCSFDDSRLDAYRPCSSSGDCFFSHMLCVKGYCVPSAGATDAGPDASNDLGPDAPDGGPQADLGPPPTAAISFDAAPFLGDRLLFDASASVGQGLTYRWLMERLETGTAVDPDGDDGGDDAQIHFRPRAPGAFRVTLNVTDAAGRHAEAEPVTVEVPGFEVFRRSGILDMEPDDEGRVWAAAEAGALLLDTASGEWTTLSPLATNVVAVGAGHAWFGLAQEDGLLRVPLDQPPDAPAEEDVERIELPVLKRVRCLRTAADDEVWIGALGGLRRALADPAGQLGDPVPPPGEHHEVVAILHRPEGSWLGRRNGVCFLMHGSSAACTPELPVIVGLDGSWQDPAIVDMGMDASGRLHVATNGKGLHRRNPDDFAPFPASPVPPLPGRLGRFGLDESGDLWLAGEEALYRLTGDGRILEVTVLEGQDHLGALRTLRVGASPRRLWLVGALGLALTTTARP